MNLLPNSLMNVYFRYFQEPDVSHKKDTLCIAHWQRGIFFFRHGHNMQISEDADGKEESLQTNHLNLTACTWVCVGGRAAGVCREPVPLKKP